MSEQGLLIALAGLSLTLPAAWVWWQGQRPEAGALQRINEQWLSPAARFFYFIGLPYLAIITGLLPARFLGLKGLENLLAINLSGDFVTGWLDLQKAVSLILLECFADGGLMIKVGLLALLLLAGLRLGLGRLSLDLPRATPSVWAILVEGLHWAFYRAIFWVITADLYLGVVGGFAWVLLEWTLCAWVQKSWAAQKPQFLIKAIILIMTATIFFYAPNLWLLWPIHWAMAGILTLRLHRRMVVG